MEVNIKEMNSIFGMRWQPVRKWFYPTWLLYELSVRFHDYALAVYRYFTGWQDYIASYIGEIGHESLTVFCSAATFIICTAFLTVPACFILYKFFKIENLTGSTLEVKIKPLF